MFGKRPPPPLWRIILYILLVLAFLVLLGYLGSGPVDPVVESSICPKNFNILGS